MSVDVALPHSYEAERGLIASVLIDPAQLHGIGVLRADDFHGAANRVLFGAIHAMHAERRPIDVPILLDRLRSAGELERIGGEAYLAEVIACEAIPAHASSYAETIRAKAERRRLIHAGLDAARIAGDETRDVSEAYRSMESAMGAGANRLRLVSNADGLASAVLSLDADDAPSVPTGFDGYDAAYGGLFAGELVILAGRTGGGKTAFALQLSEHIARSSSVLYASLEMSAEELHRRRIARESGIGLQALRTRCVSDDERDRLPTATASIGQASLWVLDDADVGMAEVTAAARKLRHDDGLGLIVIDYLQLLRPDDSRVMRERQVAAMTRALKCLARELRVPVVALSQLSRLADSAEVPRLSHLRESGAIEQDADVVLFVHRCPEVDPRDAQLIVGKHRHGQTRTFPLEWDGPSVSFIEAEPEFWTPKAA